mmetsp:Transcript_12736/g.27015  ORF Transcript_12736/g.27015 Transcript_12736/m.27015 type:complete len:99 (+) Transcript_12736:699-995(+)
MNKNEVNILTKMPLILYPSFPRNRYELPLKQANKHYENYYYQTIVCVSKKLTEKQFIQKQPHECCTPTPPPPRLSLSPHCFVTKKRKHVQNKLLQNFS